MGWREDQLRFMEKSLLFAFGQTLSIEQLYAANVTKTRMKPDNITEKATIYLCVLRKNWDTLLLYPMPVAFIVP